MIKLPFLSSPLRPTVLVSSCRGGGGGVLSAHGRLFYTRLQEGQIQKSMRKQLCCLKLYFCQPGSSERNRDITGPKREDH